MAFYRSALIPLASFIGIAFPALYTGMTAQYSITFVQAIVDHAPNQKVMAKQWLQGYQYGPLWVPPLVIPGTVSNVFLAFCSPEGSIQRLFYSLAALGIFGVLPITFFYMEPGINGALKWKVQGLLSDDGMEMMAETGIFPPSAHKHSGTQASRRWAEKSDIKTLILYWRSVHNIRSVLGGLAAIGSGFATFSQTSR